MIVPWTLKAWLNVKEMRRNNNYLTSSIILMTIASRVPNWLLSLLNGRLLFRECLSHQFSGIVDIKIIGIFKVFFNLLPTNLLSACIRIDSITQPRKTEIKGVMWSPALNNVSMKIGWCKAIDCVIISERCVSLGRREYQHYFDL